jgi:hypothetical protein
MLIRVSLKMENICLIGEGHPLYEKQIFTQNSVSIEKNNLNYKGTSPEFIAGDRKKLYFLMIKLYLLLQLVLKRINDRFLLTSSHPGGHKLLSSGPSVLSHSFCSLLSRGSS